MSFFYCNSEAVKKVSIVAENKTKDPGSNSSSSKPYALKIETDPKTEIYLSFVKSFGETCILNVIISMDSDIKI